MQECYGILKLQRTGGCIDGGVFANNPALCAYAEVRNLTEDKEGSWVPAKEGEQRPTAKNMFMLSLGTGKIKKQPYYHRDAEDWDLVDWLEPVLDIIRSGAAETIHCQLEQIFKSVDRSDYYIHESKLDTTIEKIRSPEPDGSR